MFKFRLASIMRLKEYKEEMCRDEVGQCISNLQLAEKQEKRIKDEISRLEEDINHSQEGNIDLPEVMMLYHYLRYMREELAKQKELIEIRKKELEEARMRYFAAMKERKIMQKLKEKQHKKYIYEQDKIEQAMLDDLAVRKP